MKHSKKALALLLICSLLLALTACGGNGAGAAKVQIHMPAELIESFDLDPDTITEDMAEDVDVAVTKHDDGSITLEMSKQDHEKMMQEMHDDVMDGFQRLTADQEDGLQSIKQVEANEDLSQVKLYVDRAKFENSMDGFALLGIYFASMTYQVFDGKAAEEIKVQIELIDEATGDVFDTVNYPQEEEGQS